MKISLTDTAMFAVAVVGIYSWFITKSIKNVLTREERDEKGRYPTTNFGGGINERA